MQDRPSVGAMRFLGLDLAWHNATKSSGIAALSGDAGAVSLVAVPSTVTDDESLLQTVEALAQTDAVLAIDAPLIISNDGGQRSCETMIGRRFGHAYASAHTCNRQRFPNPRSCRLVAALQDRGWRHEVAPEADRLRTGRWLFEVYPHPAQVVLFDRARIIRYKKGRIAERRAGLDELRQSMRDTLSKAEPVLLLDEPLTEFLSRDLGSLSGPQLKSYEDALDALFCAYLAAYYWVWGNARNAMLGSMPDGYIVTPMRTASGSKWTHAR